MLGGGSECRTVPCLSLSSSSFSMALSSWAAIRAFSYKHNRQVNTPLMFESEWCVQTGRGVRCPSLTSFLFSLLSTFLLRGTNFLLKTHKNSHTSNFKLKHSQSVWRVHTASCKLCSFIYLTSWFKSFGCSVLKWPNFHLLVAKTY